MRLVASDNGGVPEWPKGADCKSAAFTLRRFESFPLHKGQARMATPEWSRLFTRAHTSKMTQMIKIGSDNRPHGPDGMVRCGCSSVGRALAFQARRRGFESLRPLSVKQQSKYLLCFLKSRRILPVQRISRNFAHVAQLVERVLGKDEVSSSILDMGSLV